MTVKELISELQKLNSDKPVRIYCSYDLGHGVAGGEQIEIYDDVEYVELFNEEC